jgi:hypothetical protein
MQRGAGDAWSYPHGWIPFPALRAAGDDTEWGACLLNGVHGNDMTD